MYQYILLSRQPQAGDAVTRRSLIGSVEDDPFESAHYGSQEKKKKARGRNSQILIRNILNNDFDSENFFYQNKPDPVCLNVIGYFSLDFF